MTLILNGTDNSATTPAVTGTDTDTGVYYPAANQVALATNGTLAMLVDASGNILVNSTTLPAALATNFKNIFVKGSNNGVVTASSNDQLCSVSMYSGANSTDVPSMLFQNGLRFGLTTDLGTGGYAEKMRVNTNGIGVGGAVPSSGIGITFPASQSASSDANTLDDYEEGTWTPAITSENGSITAYTSEGTYTKIGNIVTVTGYTSLTTVGTAGGRLFIGGFPFTPTYTTSFIQPACPVRESNSTGYIYFAYINGSTADGVIQNSTAGAIAWSNSYKYSWTISYKC